MKNFLAKIGAIVKGIDCFVVFALTNKNDLMVDHITPSSSIPATLPPVAAPNPDVLASNWSTQQNAYHNVRVLCDLSGLSLGQKNDICGCIFQESRFLLNPKPNTNKDPKTGLVWSTDYGIVQVNDWFHISGMGNPKSGNEFPSVQYVLDNPQKCVQWMIDIYKNTGALEPWASWTSGAYKQWLEPTSPMWLLETSI